MKIVKLVKLFSVFLAVWGGFDVITAASNDLQKFGGIAKITISILGFTAARFFFTKTRAPCEGQAFKISAQQTSRRAYRAKPLTAPTPHAT